MAQNTRRESLGRVQLPQQRSISSDNAQLPPSNIGAAIDGYDRSCEF
jgi:hypothetical protein